MAGGGDNVSFEEPIYYQGPTAFHYVRKILLSSGYHVQAYRMKAQSAGGPNGRRRTCIIFWRAPPGEDPSFLLVKQGKCKE